MKPKKKSRGLRVRVRPAVWPPECYEVVPESWQDGIPSMACRSWLHRAGLKPLKPGESRIVTVRIEDKP